jgi:hypothetical protein
MKGRKPLIIRRFYGSICKSLCQRGVASGKLLQVNHASPQTLEVEESSFFSTLHHQRFLLTWSPRWRRGDATTSGIKSIGADFPETSIPVTVTKRRVTAT